VHPQARRRAGALARWISKSTSAAHATPGTGLPSTGLDRSCISEVGDATEQQFEYVEIFVDGAVSCM
jgi:hypothetical protein